jgi:hypothetical protein
MGRGNNKEKGTIRPDTIAVLIIAGDNKKGRIIASP